MISHTSTFLNQKAPTLWVCIDDTKIPVAVPTLDLTEKFLAQAQAFTEIKDGITKEDYDAIFDFFAELLSCNHNYIRYTAAELKAKNVTIDQIVGVLADWANFIAAIASLKN